MTVWIGVALLGGVGACARHLIGRGTPIGTLAVNVSGSFLLGLLAGAGVSSDAYLLAGTALLGSYTTFSAWMLQTQRARPKAAFALVVVSVVLGLGAAAIGRAL
jgi:CrcB protein